MKVKQELGWRFYTVVGGEIGINKLRRPKFFPDYSRINSSWITRKEAFIAIKKSILSLTP